MGSLLNPSRCIDNRPKETAATFLGLVQMQPHPYPQRRPRQPPSTQRYLRYLRCLCCGYSVRSALKRRAERVPSSREHIPSTRFNRNPNNLAVPLQRRRHRLSITSPQRSRALHITKQKRHRPRRRLRLVSHSLMVARH